MTRLAAAALLALALACACASSPASPFRTAHVETTHGGRLALHRWPTGDAASPRVLVVPELGFAPSLFAPMCERLRRAGFDVTIVEGRHATGQGSGAAGWDGWLLDVARAVRITRPQWVIAIGLGGAAALELAIDETFPPVVAVNVPARSGGETKVRAEALADGFDPARWLRTPRGDVLLAAGRRTPLAAHEALVASARPLPPAFSFDVAERLRRGPRGVPKSALHLVVSPKGNLVPGEQSMSFDAPGFRTARRLSKVELYPRDYGHLDWLVDDGSLSAVLPAIVDALEAP